VVKINFENYLNKFKSLLSHIQVSDSKNNTLNLDHGVDKAIEIITYQTGHSNKVIMIGNGGSASIANHISVDLWKNGGIKAISFSDSSLITCVSNDFGYEYVFEKPIEMFADNGDVLIAISSSGKSENILKGAEAAIRKGCKVITMSGFNPDNPLQLIGELNFYVPSNSYGYVEITHSILCHYIADVITARNIG